jgi:hypothetical protein
MSVLRRFRVKSPAMLLVVAGLLVAFSGLALAASGRTHGQGPARRDAMSHQHGEKSKLQAKRDDQADRNAGKDAGEGDGQGPPAWTHGYEVSKIAHDTPPGPGHGQAVSAVARSWGKTKHGQHADRHPSGRPGS